MNPLALEQFGFRERKPSAIDNCDRLWGYTVKDQIGRRFPITVRLWDFRKYNADRLGWDAVAHMKVRINGRENFIELLLTSVEGMSPEEIVDYYTSAWQDLMADYTRRWGED